MRSICVYSDRGVSGESLKQLMRCLSELQLPARRIDAQQLLNEPWEESSQLLIVPGGRDIFYQELLQGKGTDKMRAFVEAGGSYLGICAGAYFGCSRIEFEKGQPLEVCADRSLHFYPGQATGPAYGFNKYHYEHSRGAEAARISWNEGECRVYFNGGCTFEPFPLTSPDAKVLSSYLDLPGAPPAIIETSFGKGRVILSGVHFEYAYKYLKREDPYLIKLQPLLEPHEETRLSLLKEILGRLLNLLDK
ncbi:MAG: BPL-N domain-containing protein [Chlamydiota bacterium]